MPKRISFLKRGGAYLILSFGYAATAHANSGAFHQSLNADFFMDFAFNMAGAVFGGIAQLCFSLNKSGTYIRDIIGKAIRNIILSVFVGFVIFICTEPSGFWEQSSGMKQLFFVTLGGAFASETMEFLRRFWKNRLNQMDEAETRRFERDNPAPFPPTIPTQKPRQQAKSATAEEFEEFVEENVTDPEKSEGE